MWLIDKTFTFRIHGILASSIKRRFFYHFVCFRIRFYFLTLYYFCSLKDSPRVKHCLTFLVVLPNEGKVVIHVRRNGVVEEIGGQLTLQKDRFVSEFTNLDEKFLITRNWKRHRCAFRASPRPCARVLPAQPFDFNSATQVKYLRGGRGRDDGIQDWLDQWCRSYLASTRETLVRK